MDASSLPAVRAARALYKLPYYHARMKCEADANGIAYRSERIGRRAEFRGRYRLVSAVQFAEVGTLEPWLTERYYLYTVRNHRVYSAAIHHDRWPLQIAEAEIETNTMALAAGIALPSVPPLLHFAQKLEVIIWLLRSLYTQTPL